MRYVGLNATIGEITGVLSAQPYLDRLAEIAPLLPGGARAFATDPERYDFYGKRCVKDLKLQGSHRDGTTIELFLRHNCWKHDDDLTITYTGVTDCSTVPANWDRRREPRLDEIQAHESGCTHELACWQGTLTITCGDLAATWIETDCPDLPR